MMSKILRISFLLIIYFVSANTVFAGSEVTGGWSAPVNGLRGRLIAAEGNPLDDLRVINAYLELQNVSDVGNPLEIYYQDSNLHGQLLNQTGEIFPGAGLPASIMTPLPYRLTIPYDGTLRFKVSVTGYFVPKRERGTLLALSTDAWLMKNDEECFLQATFTAVKSGETGHREWTGSLLMPKVKIPKGFTKNKS